MLNQRPKNALIALMSDKKKFTIDSSILITSVLICKKAITLTDILTHISATHVMIILIRY